MTWSYLLKSTSQELIMKTMCDNKFMSQWTFFFSIYLSFYFLNISYTMIFKYIFSSILRTMMNDHASWQHFPDKLRFIDNNKLKLPGKWPPSDPCHSMLMGEPLDHWPLGRGRTAWPGHDSTSQSGSRNRRYCQCLAELYWIGKMCHPLLSAKKKSQNYSKIF